MTDSMTGSNFIAIATWFAPSPLFILVNLVIGTIALVSCFNAAPKIKIIQRAKSFNTRHSYNNHQEQQTSSITKPESESESTQTQLVQTPNLIKRVVSFNLSLQKLASVKTHYLQPETDTENSSAELDPKLICDSGDDKNKVELKRSVSEKECSMTLDWEAEEDEEALERRRPATAMGRSETTTCKEDEAWDAKADDFISTFKKQLRLQRLNSFVRYQNTLTLPSFE